MVKSIEFKNNKIILSFCDFKKYLNNFDIEVNEELIRSLCHENYTITKNKNEYICKMKYSEERIKKANAERIKKRNANKNNNISFPTELQPNDTTLKTDLKEKPKPVLEELQNNMCLSPNNEHNKFNYDVNYENYEYLKKNQEIQTARTSSYLFENEIQCCKNNMNFDKQDNIFTEPIPEDVLDVYEELDIKEQIIEKLEIDILKLKEQINIRDKKISELIKKIDNLKINSFTMNKKDIIHDLDKLSLQKNKIHEIINTFIISLEKVSPKKVYIFVNERIIELKKEINDINILSNSINHKIIELLN